MPSVAMTITMDKSNGTSFMVRVYPRVQEIGKTPTDVWEVHNLKVDDETMDYLSENQLLATMLKRHKSKGADHDPHLNPIPD